MFNCGEMSQKVITEHVGSNSLGQMTNIFVTSKTWNNIGGLPGKDICIGFTIKVPTDCIYFWIYEVNVDHWLGDSANSK